MRRGELLKGLEDGSLLPRLEPVYGPDAPGAARRLLYLFECDHSLVDHLLPR